MTTKLNAAKRLVATEVKAAKYTEYNYEDFENQLGPEGEAEFHKLPKPQKNKILDLWDHGDNYRAKDALWEVVHGKGKTAAVARLAATKVVSSYTGTKVRDLAVYLKGLNPAVSPVSNSGGRGAGGPGPGTMQLRRMSVDEARKLATALIGDGWYGQLRKKKGTQRSGDGSLRATTTEYMVYFPDDEAYDDKPIFKCPVIKMYKPNDAGEVSISIVQDTHQSMRNKKSVNRKFF
jgi:hypothetical protein